MSTDNYLCDLKEYTIKKKSIPYHKKSMLRKKKDKGQKMFLESPSDISLHSNFSESEYEEYKFQHLYLLNLIVFRENYKNFVALVNPELENKAKNPHYSIADNKDYRLSHANGIYFDGTDLYYFNRKNPDSFLRFLGEIEKREERFIIVDIGTRDHQNIIILDTLTKNGYYFEPHGVKLYFLNAAKQKELDKVFNKAGYRFYFPDEYYLQLPSYGTDGFQKIESRHKLLSLKANPKLESGGYCFYWSMYFINMIIKHPHLPVPNLYQQLLLGLMTLKDKDFHKHIRTYAQRMEKSTVEKYPDIHKNHDNDIFKYKQQIYLEYFKVFNYHYPKFKLK